MTYIPGFLTSVPDKDREAYIGSAHKAQPLSAIRRSVDYRMLGR